MSQPKQGQPRLFAQLPLLDGILEQHRAQLGADFIAYRNHAYRVANFCSALAPSAVAGEPVISIAAAFHDLGIWTGRTFDYLQPSRQLASDYLDDADYRSMGELVDAMICQHHKIRHYRGTEGELVEVFRQADWVDVTGGFITASIPKGFLADVFARFPNAGFHRCLLRLTCRHAVLHPLKPLPMIRW